MQHPDPTTMPLVVSVSGGKDSTATCLHLKDLGIPYKALFLDTGWEAASTYRYLRDELPEIIGPIVWRRMEIDLDGKPELLALAQGFEARLGHYSAMIRLILTKGMFPGRQVRFCTQGLKAQVSQAYLDSLDDEVISVVGIRAEESQARAKMGEWEWSDSTDSWVWRPLIAWTYDDVIALHTKHGVRPCSLYLQGASRVGCWPCIYARKAEIRHLAEADPDRVALIADLEQVISDRLWDRHSKAGKDPDAFSPRSWFQGPTPRSTNGEARPREAWPIDRVVEWSRTSRGGRQWEMFSAPERDRGCMRWGLCETHSPRDD